MVTMIIFCCLVVSAFAAPQSGPFRRFPGVGPINGPINPGAFGPNGRNTGYDGRNNGYDGRNYNGPYENVRILEETNEINPDGSYEYSYATGDGQQVQVEGVLKDLGDPEGPSQVSRGSYSYTAPDGTPISVEWIADELGFRVQGAHIHKSIQNALEVSPAIPAIRNSPFPRGPAPFSRRGPVPAPFGNFFNGVPIRGAKIIDDDDN